MKLVLTSLLYCDPAQMSSLFFTLLKIPGCSSCSGLWLWIQRRDPLLHSECGFFHHARGCRQFQSAAGLWASQPHVWVCGHCRGQRAPSSDRDGVRAHSLDKCEWWNPGVLPVSVSRAAVFLCSVTTPALQICCVILLCQSEWLLGPNP